jgi:predicted MFS family arabinose efflux permease
LSERAASLPVLLRTNRDFRRLFIALATSLLGDYFAYVALSGLIFELTGSAASPALVFALEALPPLLLSPVGGIFADRLNRKRLIVAVDLARVVPALAFILAARFGGAALLYGAVLVLATLSAFAEPTFEAALPNVVSRSELPTAQAALGGLYSVGLLVGAALGGVTTAFLGRDVTFGLNALTFVVSAAMVFGIRSSLQGDEERRTSRFLQDAREGLRYARRSVTVMGFLLLTFGLRVAYGAVALLPSFSLVRYDTGDSGTAMLLVAQGAGAVIGPFIGRSMSSDQSQRARVAGGAMVLFGCAYGVLAASGSLPLGAAAVFVGHLGVGAAAMLSFLAIQIATPDRLLGRTMGLQLSLSYLHALTSLMVAAAVVHFGLGRTTTAAAAFAVIYGLCWVSVIPRRIRTDESSGKG